MKERAKLSKMEGEVASLTVVCDGLTEDLEKCHRFSRKVSKAVALDTGTAAILNDGDFAHDAILMKAEQLVKLEVGVYCMFLIWTRREGRGGEEGGSINCTEAQFLIS